MTFCHGWWGGGCWFHSDWSKEVPNLSVHIPCVHLRHLLPSSPENSSTCVYKWLKHIRLLNLFIWWRLIDSYAYSFSALNVDQNMNCGKNCKTFVKNKVEWTGMSPVPIRMCWNSGLIFTYPFLFGYWCHVVFQLNGVKNAYVVGFMESHFLSVCRHSLATSYFHHLFVEEMFAFTLLPWWELIYTYTGNSV